MTEWRASSPRRLLSNTVLLAPRARRAARAERRSRRPRPLVTQCYLALGRSREVDAVVGQELSPAGPLGVEHRVHRLAHRLAGIDPDLGMDQELEPFEPPGPKLVVRAAVPPVLVRIGPVVVGIEVRRVREVDGAGDGPRAVVWGRGVPGDDGVEPVVELERRPDGMQA